MHATLTRPFLFGCFPIVLATLAGVAAGHEPSSAGAGSAGPRVLVFSNTGYYRHPDIPKINRWLVLLGAEHGFEADVTEHPKDLKPAVLAQYDVLVLNNANELDKVIPQTERAAVEQWFSGGTRGIVGLHAALVHQTRWPWLGELGGCDFDSDSDFARARVTVDPKGAEHPAMRGQPAEFWLGADWTNHSRSVTGLPGFTVLMRVDETTYTPVRDYFAVRGGKPMGADHPIAWTNEPPTGGRFFYTELGHDLRSLETPFARRHVAAAIRWAGSAPGR